MRRDGTVWCWGRNEYGQLGNGATTNSSTPVSVTGITTATEVSAGGFNSCATLASGAVQCWGSNEANQLQIGSPVNSNVPVTIPGITTANGSVVVGALHMCVPLTDGTVKCWGANYGGQLGDGTLNFIDSSVPTAVSGLTNVTSLTVGAEHSCAAIAQLGAVKCWGRGDSGQAGYSFDAGGPVPFDVIGLSYYIRHEGTAEPTEK